MIKILEKENNKKGDLFGRLMKDFMLALGYGEARLNIHKSGREIDLKAAHRTEARVVVAECKAKAKPSGGDEVNKFYGALDAERRQYEKVGVSGYFISLNGFKETAVEQEKEAGDRLVLVDGKKVIEELIKGHIIVSPEKAMERAGRCAAQMPISLKTENDYELLAHKLGWIWCVY
ncbi:MAG: restriction endonuclease, partial [Nitrospinae bacterium]|nr:restriction endonuclease [Nitrospinota bacterium]